MSIAAARPTVSDLSRFGPARAGLPDDAVDGQQPADVVVPNTPEHVAVVLLMPAKVTLVTN